jgi:TetR/AcrR family tetracycline transcriptional repressor
VAKSTAAGPRTRGKLSRARILTAALQLVDLDGLEALTMRRLADQLKVDPMSLYNHVDGKDALLDGIAEALWNEVQLPDGETEWREALRGFATALRGMAHAHPHAYPLLMARGIMTAPELQAIDGAMHALERAGLDREHAAEMIRTLFAYAVGYGMLELSTPTPAGANRTEQIVNLTRTLPRDAPFHLVEVARLVCDCDMDYQFELGLDLIVTGLESRLPQP